MTFENDTFYRIESILITGCGMNSAHEHMVLVLLIEVWAMQIWSRIEGYYS